MKNPVIHRSEILLPSKRKNVDYSKWAIVAVDQYTSQPEYWRQVEEIVGDAPSALRVTLPEAYLADGQDHTEEMQKNMRAYLDDQALRIEVRSGYVLVERATQSGVRIGLMAALDLEQYDFASGSQSLIRATEGTVIERVPPRVKVRRGACLELPHVLMLLDDPEKSAIEKLYDRRDTLELLYDFDLMQNGGHIRGWRVEGDQAQELEDALDNLYDRCDGLFLAVGDGNHSLAAARAHWLEFRERLPEYARACHPARYALAEIVNLHSDAIRFEPIYRILRSIDPVDLQSAYEAHLRDAGIGVRDGREVICVYNGFERGYAYPDHPLRDLQSFLDDYVASHPGAQIDYIHGEDTVREMARAEHAAAFLPCNFEKDQLFPYVRANGVLPRKTFSMGEANEKRYYLEARRL